MLVALRLGVSGLRTWWASTTRGSTLAAGVGVGWGALLITRQRSATLLGSLPDNTTGVEERDVEFEGTVGVLGSLRVDGCSVVTGP